MKCPCRNCADRLVGCHVVCELYQGYRCMLDEANKQKQADREAAAVNALGQCRSIMERGVRKLRQV